jgi:hypothetical protein
MQAAKASIPDLGIDRSERGLRWTDPSLPRYLHFFSVDESKREHNKKDKTKMLARFKALLYRFSVTPHANGAVPSSRGVTASEMAELDALAKQVKDLLSSAVVIFLMREFSWFLPQRPFFFNFPPDILFRLCVFPLFSPFYYHQRMESRVLALPEKAAHT